jgi:hypothetical protein
MIDSVSEIRTVKAMDLPPTFDILVGHTTYRFELESVEADTVYMRCTDTNETMWLNPQDEVAILVPDTLANARVDIELDLMTRGM